MAQAKTATTTNRVHFASAGASRRTSSPQATAATSQPTELESLHLRLLRDLGCTQPSRIIGNCDALNLVDRAEHVEEILRTVGEYVDAIVADTAWNAPAGSIDCDYISSMLTDTASDIVGHIRRKVNELHAARPSKPYTLVAAMETAR
jgi:hypothetical protein